MSFILTKLLDIIEPMYFNKLERENHFFIVIKFNKVSERS